MARRMTEQIVVRLEPELRERLDGYADRVRAETGMDITTGAVVRRLLALGLDAVEVPVEAPPVVGAKGASKSSSAKSKPSKARG